MMKNKMLSNSKIQIKNNNSLSNKNKDDPKYIKFFKNLVKNPVVIKNLIVFKSIYDEFIMIYQDENSSIVSYNLVDYKKLIEIKNSNKYINEIKYYLDKSYKRDLVVIISMERNNIKLWNANTWDLILNIDYKIGNFYLNLNSICFLKNKNNIYLVASCVNLPDIQLIHIYDLNGNKVKEINDTKSKSNYVDTFYDTNFSKSYIIIATNDDIRAIDYEENKIFKKYISIEGKSKVINIKLNEKQKQALHINGNYTIKQEIPLKGPIERVIIKEYSNITKLFAAENDGFVRIWNFHDGNLLSEINISKSKVYDICLWDDEHLFAGYGGGIKLVDLKNNKIIKNFEEKGEARSIVTIDYHKFGKCLIIENYKGIFLWINKYS